jgi:hypothetical protein
MKARTARGSASASKWGFETHSEPLLPASLFVGRVLRSCALSTAILTAALGIGVVGYHLVAALPWIDSLLNASMILSGMGPVNELRGDAAKIFASAYALFSGVVFITSMGVLVAPVLHRFMHRFHLDGGKDAGDS